MTETPEERLSIHERIGAIVAEMPAIGKNQTNTQQKFQFRGHDDVMNALNPLLSKYRVFFTPRVKERLAAQRQTKSGNIMYEVNLLVEYTFYGPLGDKVVASAWGEGTDSGDKSTNKAMTMALKNVLAQTFAVSTEEQSKYDTDQHTDEPSVVSWRNAGFDPAKQMDAGAPTGWEPIQALILDLDAHIGAWLSNAIVGLYGDRAANLTGDTYVEAGRRSANALARVRDELFADGDFPPPSDDEYRRVFAWAFNGVDATPPGPFDDDGSAEDAPVADTGGQETGDEQVPGQDSLLEPENGSGGTTAAPDE